MQRGCPRGERRYPVHLDTLGERAGERAGEPVDVDRVDELEVEVLGVALVADTEREPEADLRAGREPLRERQRERGDPERSLERAGEIPV